MGSLCNVLQLNRPQTIALAGSGGKTTLMKFLALELAGQGASVVMATTTKMYPPNWLGSSPWLLQGALPSASQVEERLAQGAPLAVGDSLGPDGKLHGISLEQAAALGRVRGAWVLIEADGSRGRPLKAWAAHEPVVPEATALLVILAGASGLGKPLGEEHVHRPEIFGRVCGLEPGDPVEAGQVVKVLTNGQGPLRVMPSGCRAALVISQAKNLSPLMRRDLAERFQDGPYGLCLASPNPGKLETL